MEIKEHLHCASTKFDCLNIAIQITTAWGNSGNPQHPPDTMIELVYNTLKKLLKDANEEFPEK